MGKKSNNSIIKRKILLKILKKEGITRINSQAIEELDKKINIDVSKLARVLREKMIIHGRKTLLIEDVK